MKFPDSDRGEHLGDAFRLDREKQLLKQYYAGQQMESPNGGFLICLGIRQEETGDAVGIFECSASWLRYEVAIRKATRTERKKVRDALKSGEEPACPRCVMSARLVRAGKSLVCNHCGIAYGKV